MTPAEFKHAKKNDEYSKLAHYFWRTFMTEEMGTPARDIASARWKALSPEMREDIENAE